MYAMRTYNKLVEFVKSMGVYYAERNILRRGVCGLYYDSEKLIVVDPTLPIADKISTLLHEYGHHLTVGLPYADDPHREEFLASLFAIQTVGMFGGDPAGEVHNLRRYRWDQTTEAERQFIRYHVQTMVEQFCLTIGLRSVIAL